MTCKRKGMQKDIKACKRHQMVKQVLTPQIPCVVPEKHFVNKWRSRLAIDDTIYEEIKQHELVMHMQHTWCEMERVKIWSSLTQHFLHCIPLCSNAVIVNIFRNSFSLRINNHVYTMQLTDSQIRCNQSPTGCALFNADTRNVLIHLDLRNSEIICLLSNVLQQQSYLIQMICEYYGHSSGMWVFKKK